MTPGQCRSCGADILWATTVGGAHVPLDLEPEKRFVPTGESDHVALMNTYRTHFATCPDAAEHRKRKSKE